MRTLSAHSYNGENILKITMLEIYEVFDASTEQLVAELGAIRQQLRSGAVQGFQQQQ